MKRLLLVLPVLLAAACSKDTPLGPEPQFAKAAPSVTITDLGTLGGTNSDATGINASGQVVGYSELPGGTTHAFLWQNGTMTDLGTLGGTHSYASGINSAGQIVGRSFTTGGVEHAFLWQNGTMTDVSWPATGGPDIGVTSSANGINDTGLIVGHAWSAQLGSFAFLYQIGSGWSSLNPSGFSAAYGVNNAGQVAGGSQFSGYQLEHAFFWPGSLMTDLGTLPGDNYSDAYGIDSKGLVVGRSGNSNASTVRGFIWKKGNGMTDLGSLSSQYPYSVAYGIFDGQVVGTTSRDPVDGGGLTGFLWQKGKMISLGVLPGHCLSEARAINSKGQIVGQGVACDNSRHAILWTIK